MSKLPENPIPIQNPLKLSDFDFSLPSELVAQEPAAARDRSRLMIIDRRTGTIRHDLFTNLTQYLAHHPLMVFNDTKVVPAKLVGRKKHTGKPVEVLLIREIKTNRWEALVKGLGGMKTGSELVFGTEDLIAVLLEKRDGRGILCFHCSGELKTTLENAAQVPLPPYIKRNTSPNMEKLDRERYQTVYAKNAGAIAAPTAGLHFTDPMLRTINPKYAETVFLTLHVGPGTFQPVRSEIIYSHTMEKEFYRIPRNTWNRLVEAKATGRDILAVGTTSTRTLESVNLATPVENDVSGWTNRFIYPGYEFKNVQRLLTNFHLPKSTLYLLVCAFAGKRLMDKAYETAKHEKYRFFSYGDAMLIL
ncbi:MAG: tRNA preQ1(34) S-adenosylmethionine ribosyltransferase-isomerase QueA [Nitrospinales bacterium]